LKFILMSTFHSDFKKNSPYSCRCRLYPDFLIGTNAEMNKMFDDYDKLSHLEQLGDFRLYVSRLSNNNIPYARQMLIKLYDFCWQQISLRNNYTHQDLVGTLLSYKFYQRLSSLRCALEIYQLPEIEMRFVLLMIRENQQVSSINGTIRSLVKKGVIIVQPDGTCEFSSPLIHRLVFNQIISPDHRPAAAPTGPVTLILQCISLFEGEWLKNNVGRRKNNLPLEDTWQKEFFRVAGTQLPFSCTLSSEVGRTFGNTIKAVDFYVDGTLQWMIEFISESNNIQKHLDRFDPTTGKYRLIPKKKWLIVDFRASVPSQLLPHVLYVTYDVDFTSAVVRMVDMETKTIPFNKSPLTVSTYLFEKK